MDTPGGMLGSGLTPFGWPNDSLRTGPLSPALLTGPSSAMVANNQAAAASLFTPGTTAALGVANTVSFPPPSPATAALFAMMTHATPVTAPAPGAGVVANGDSHKVGGAAGMEGGGPRPHEGPNEGNAFDASFAQAASSTGREGSALAPPTPGAGPGPGPVGAPPAQGSQQHAAHTLNGVAQQGRPLGPGQPNGGSHTPQPQPYDFPPNNAAQMYAPSSLGPGVPPPGAFGGPQNPLYLLSQASQHPQLLPPGQQPYPPGHGPPPGRYPAHHQPMPQPMGSMTAYAPHPGMSMGPPMGPPHTHAHPHPHMQDDAVVAAAALSGLGGYGIPPPHVNGGVMGVPHPQQVVPPQAIMAGVDQGQSPATSASGSAKGKRGSVALAGAANKKRKSNGPGEVEAAPHPAPAKAKAPTKKSAKKASQPKEEDHSDDDDGPTAEDMGPASPHNPNETEEDKRKNFLERNRQAALKCRQRKKAWLASLQTKVESLTQDNEGLQATVTHLTDEIASLRAILAAHRDCPTAQGAMNGAHQQQGQY